MKKTVSVLQGSFTHHVQKLLTKIHKSLIQLLFWILKYLKEIKFLKFPKYLAGYIKT